MKATIAFAVALSAVRVWIGATVDPEPLSFVQVYKDIAHLFMGGLAVAWWRDQEQWQWRTFWTLNAIELAVALISRS